MPLNSALLSQVVWRAVNLWPLAIASAALLLLALLVLYPPQLREVRRTGRIVLPALRLLVALILVTSILKPIAYRAATAEERGAVLVLVDKSRSMGVVDNTRSPAQLVALADALGKLPGEVRGDTVTALSTELERLRTLSSDVRGAQEDLEYARVSGRDIQYRQTRLHDAFDRYSQAAAALLARAQGLDGADDLVKQLKALAAAPPMTSRRQWQAQTPADIRAAAVSLAQYQEAADDRLYESNPDVRTACDAVATLSRYALVESALLRPGGLLRSIQKEASIAGFSVDGEVAPLALLQSSQPVARLDATPDGDQTDLPGGIAKAMGGKPVRAVVLFSDGRQVGPEGSVISGLTPEGVPVFTVGAAAAEAPRDVSFASISAPASVFAGQSIVVKAELRHYGFEGDIVQLHCQIGAEPQQTRGIALHDGKPATAEFSARVQQPGVQRVRLWFPPVHGEATTDNNQAERYVKVVPDRMKVLLIAGSPTWDFQYVRNALARLPEVQLKDVIVDPANPRLGLPTPEIMAQDVIVLFDVPVAALDQKHWDAVERMAQVSGASVILVAGDAHLPAEYDKYVSTATLLPFRAPYKQPAWSAWPGEEPSFHFVPTAEGESLPFLRLERDNDPALSQQNGGGEGDVVPRRWEQLPGFFRFLKLPELQNPIWKPTARPLLVEEVSRLPVLTEMQLGAGRAFFVALDETWRWRMKVGERDQEHFWWQLIQYASEPPYFAHDGPLALDTDKVSAEPGQAIHVRARIAAEVPDPPPSYAVEILQDGKPISEQPLSPTGPGGSRRYAANLTLGPGDYELRWTVSGLGGRTYSVRAPLHVAVTSESELADLAGDPGMLRKLADATGGEFFTLEQVNRLPERLAAAGKAQEQVAEVRLWDSPYLFALIVGCLGVEWALRKHMGLA